MIVNKTISGTEALLLRPALKPPETPRKKNPARWLRPVTAIVALAWAVRLVSLVDILYALLRYQPPLIYWLGKWVPFEISEGNRIRMFLMSVVLLMLASGLQRGKRIAWQITIAGLMLAPILHLGRGVIWPQALINLMLVGFLLMHRNYFVAKSDARSIRFAVIICPLLAAALLIFGTVRLHALHKDLTGDISWFGCAQTAGELVIAHHSWTQVATTHHTRDLFRILRMGGTLIALGGLMLIMRPVLIQRMTRVDQREKARKIIAQHGEDPFDPYALLPDKSYFFTTNGRVVVPYVVSGKLAIVLADPIGPSAERPGAIAEFALFCRHQDWEPVFYEVTEELSLYYENAGLTVFQDRRGSAPAPRRFRPERARFPEPAHRAQHGA